MVEKKNAEVAIEVNNLSKVYKLYDKPSDRFREALRLTRKQYREHYALRDVNMTIRQGETVGIIGTNGSGKSTILKIITGVLNPTAGQVQVNGRISALLELGAGFDMEYNGIENVYLNGTMIGFSEEEIERKLPEILDFADIGDYVHQPVKTYSSGMFVRLAFAVAINIDPEILIVDEALSVGDVFFQAKCYRKFEEFKAKGKTIVFVSHDLSSVSKYCDRVYLLNQGVLLGEGSPKKMIDAYKQVLVGQYEEGEEGKNGDGQIRMGLLQRIVGSLGQHHSHLESCAIHTAGGIVQRGGIDLHARARRHQKRLHLGGVIGEILLDILLHAQDQDGVRSGDVQLAVSVVFHRVQQFVVTVAVADLDGQLAEGRRGQRRHGRRSLQGFHAGLVHHALGHGLFAEDFHQLRQIHIGDLPSVFAESRVCDR